MNPDLEQFLRAPADGEDQHVADDARHFLGEMKDYVRREELDAAEQHVKVLRSLVDQANSVGYGTAFTLQIERIQKERDAAKADNASLHGDNVVSKMETLKAKAEVERLRDEVDILRRAIKGLVELPNLINRCGGWKDVANAIESLRQALGKESE